VEVPLVPKEDAPLQEANGHEHPEEKLSEPVEDNVPEVTVPEVCGIVTGKDFHGW